MSIYPYVYRLDHPTTGEFYIGYRCANKVPATEDFGHTYKSSSKYLSHPFEEYTQTIIAEFFNAEDAYDFEQLNIYENWDNPLLINRHCTYGKPRFHNIGGYKLSAEQCRNISIRNTGRIFTLEHCSNIANSLQGRTLSQEHIAKISANTTGLKRTPQQNAENSARQSGRICTPEAIAANRAGHLGLVQSDATKRKKNAKNTGQKRTPETKLRLSLARKEWWRLKKLRDLESSQVLD